MTVKYYVEKIDYKAENQIEPDEPCFVIRATDRYAPDIIMLYYQLVTHPLTGIHGWSKDKKESAVFLSEIAAHLSRVHKWQADNPDRVKIPD